MTFAVLRLGWRKRTDGFDGFHTVARILNTVTLAIEDGLIADGMQVSKAFGELEFGAITGDRTIGRLLAFHRIWQIIGVDGEKPTHARIFVLKVASCFELVDIVNDVALQFAEDEVQHVIKMHSDIGGNPEGLALIAFPAFHIPFSSAGDIG